MIVKNEFYPTKKKLKEILETTNKDVMVEDPSIINPRTFSTDEMKDGEKVVVTNHPRRSYFATIEKFNGKMKVR